MIQGVAYRTRGHCRQALASRRIRRGESLVMQIVEGEPLLAGTITMRPADGHRARKGVARICDGPVK